MTEPRYTPQQMTEVADYAASLEAGDPFYDDVVGIARQAAETERALEAREKLIAALERTVRELRDCLQECSDPDEGWPHTGIADTFEASRRLVPDVGRTP